MKIRFLETYTIKDEEGRTFLQGEIYDLPDSTARHFVRRNRAVVVDEPGSIKQQVAAAKTTVETLGQEVPETVEEELSVSTKANRAPIPQKSFRKQEGEKQP